MKKYVFFMLLAFGSQEGESMRRQEMPAGNMQDKGMSMHALVRRARSSNAEERDSALRQIKEKYETLKQKGRECRDKGKEAEAQLNKAIDAAKKNKQAAEAYKIRSDTRKGQVLKCMSQIDNLTAELRAKENDLKRLGGQVEESSSRISELNGELERYRDWLAPLQQLDEAVSGDDVETFKATLGGLLESAELESAKAATDSVFPNLQISLLSFVKDMCDEVEVNQLMGALKSRSGLFNIARDTFGIQSDEEEREPVLSSDSDKPGHVSEYSDSGRVEKDAEKIEQILAEEEDRHEPRNAISGADESNQDKKVSSVSRVSSEDHQEEEEEKLTSSSEHESQDLENHSGDVADNVPVVVVSDDDDVNPLLQTVVRQSKQAQEQASMTPDEEAV